MKNFKECDNSREKKQMIQFYGEFFSSSLVEQQYLTHFFDMFHEQIVNKPKTKALTR